MANDMEKNCEGNETVYYTVILASGVIIFLWWWGRKSELKRTLDKAVNTDPQPCKTGAEDIQNVEISENVYFNKSKDDSEKLWSNTNLNGNWKAVWVGDEELSAFSNRHRTELSLNLSTGEVIRKYEILRQRNTTHVIATL